MTRLVFQFHADPAELLTMASAWTLEHGLFAVAEQFFPDYQAVRVPNGVKLTDAAGRLTVRRVCLSRAEPDLDTSAGSDVLDRNPDCLAVDLGKHTEDGLREAALAVRTDDQESLQVWRAVIRNAKSQMRAHKGATVVNPHTGARGPVPSHLHTEGAHRLAAAGVKMLATAGWNEYEFDDLR